MGMSFVILLLIFLAAYACSSSRAQGQGDNQPQLPCLQKLMPCTPYLSGSGSGPGPPPATCCLPLKETVVHDTQCLCQVFNNPALLKNFNITQDDALALVRACGANADTSICNKVTAPSPAASGPSTNGSGIGSHKKSVASRTSYSFVGLGGCATIAAAAILFLSSIIVPAF